MEAALKRSELRRALVIGLKPTCCFRPGASARLPMH